MLRVGIRSASPGLGLRVERILAAEPEVFTAAVSTHEGARWDVIVTDEDPIPDAAFSEAERFHARLVARARPRDRERYGLFGCDIRGVAEALAARESENSGRAPSLAAWTVAGEQLRRGDQVSFPDPLGRRLGRRVGQNSGTTLVEVPIMSDWAGVSVTAADGGNTTGVADDRLFVEAIALAAGAMLDGWSGGWITPGTAAEPYLQAATRAGLGVARLG